MNEISLKYRIALAVFLLEAAMISLVLWKVQAISSREIVSKLHEQEGIYLSLLSDLGRNALITSEYGELQGQVENLKNVISLERVLVTDVRNIVVADSDRALLGRAPPELRDNGASHWESRRIALASGQVGGEVHILVSNSRIRAVWRRSIIHGITVAGLSMVVIAVAGLVSGHLLVRRLNTLSDFAGSMAAGNLETRVDISGADEVARLGAAFNSMARQLQTTLDSLKVHEERMYLALRAANLGLYDLNVKTGAVVVNAGYALMLGCEPREFQETPANFVERLHPDDREPVVAVYRAYLKGETPEYRAEFRQKTQAGGWKWILSVGKIVERDAAGNPVRMLGTHMDVSQAKEVEERTVRALREKEVLLKEIHHRVKNNMQVIYSLLNLQAEGAADGAVRALFEESRDRVNAMALIHEKLYRAEDLAHVDFKAYLQSLVQDVARTFKRPDLAVSVDMEGLALDVNTGIPCGLIVNELVSNSFKHAFPEGRKGTIQAGLRLDSAGRHVLTVEDDGVGLPTEVDLRTASSLGLKLVEVLAAQIHGTIELSRTAGTRVSITFPGPAPGTGGSHG